MELMSGTFGTCSMVPCDDLESPEEHSAAFGKALAQMYQMQEPYCLLGLSYYGDSFPKPFRSCAIASSLGLSTSSEQHLCRDAHEIERQQPLPQNALPPAG